MDWRKQQLAALQRKRQRLLQNSLPASFLTTHLPRVEQQIQVLQEESTKIAILKAERTWREHGETDAGYLKKSATARQAQRSIPMLWNSRTGNHCSNREQLLDVVHDFYANLFSAEPICSNSLDRMMSHIPSDCQLDEAEADFLTLPFDLQEISAHSSRAPKSSSPGPDGLSYVFLNLIFHHKKYSDLILNVYNDALSKNLFPSSWLETSVCLLPKKGDLTSLKNWRPITLINCDAKIYTRMLNARLVSVISPLITPHQSGFMKERFIADNGLLAQIACEQASVRQSDEVGLLCDQEKAYDRVHPTYLRAVLHRFHFPTVFVDSILGLFYGTSMRVNVNGYLTHPISLGRGLRQGDPISPLLFNLVLEPLIKSIIYSNRIQGFSPPSLSPHSTASPSYGPSSLQSLKVLAYADDLLIYLKNVEDLAEVQQLIRCYNQASNAKMNYDKTVAFSVSGRAHPHWLPALHEHGITKWHDRNDSEPLIYLGYPLATSSSQKKVFQDRLITKIKHACDIHKQRQLSVRGRATVLNVLILSTLWHVLRVSWFPQRLLGTIGSICREFLMFRVFPPVSFDVLQLPLKQGGLGVLNPAIQQLALQFRWLTPLIHENNPTSLTVRWIGAHMESMSTLPLLDRRLPFIFPALRRGLLHEYRPGLCSILYRAFDSLFDRAMVSKELNVPLDQPPQLTSDFCLSLPLSATVSWPAQIKPSVQHSFDKVLVKDAFFFDPVLQCLIPLSSSQGNSSLIIGKYRILKLLRWIQSGEVILLPFFARLCLPRSSDSDSVNTGYRTFDAFCSALVDPLIDPNKSVITPKSFRQAHLEKIKQSLAGTLGHTRSSSFWKRFWNLDIPLAIRTPWYRLLHRKFPNAERLQALVPNICDSHCRLCGDPSTPENSDHFLFRCPSKLIIWRLLWKQFFGVHDVPLLDIANALYKLIFPRQKLRLIQNDSIIGCAFLGIWKAHWRFIFDNTPFDSMIIYQQITVLITSMRSDTVPSAM